MNIDYFNCIATDITRLHIIWKLFTIKTRKEITFTVQVTVAMHKNSNTLHQ